jgi:hypothetical protein
MKKRKLHISWKGISELRDKKILKPSAFKKLFNEFQQVTVHGGVEGKELGIEEGKSKIRIISPGTHFRYITHRHLSIQENHLNVAIRVGIIKH